LWHKTQLSPDPDFGSIQEFWFDSSSRGQLVVDRSQGKATRFEVYATTDGGETWALKASSDDPIRLPNARPSDKAAWRAVTEKNSYRVQRRSATGWETVALFPIRAGECK
jgi:photosystem II stability/assembly factor-like uncharacterized protein